MRTDRWLIIRDTPGQPLLVLGAAEDYDRAQDLYGEACQRFDGVRIVPHADRVAELLLAPDEDDGHGQHHRQPADATTQRVRRITALALLQLCAALGAEFWLAGPNDLRIRIGQDFPLTTAVMAAMRVHESELLEFARQGYRDMLWREVLRRPLDGAAA